MTEERKQLMVALDAMRMYFNSRATFPLAQRLQRLRELRNLLESSRLELLSALDSDLGKCEAEALYSEFLPIMESLKFFIGRTARLASPKRVGAGRFNWRSKAYLYPEPRGVVQITSTWNYPLLLALDPVIGAIAAGNCVVLKLSGTAPATEMLLNRLLQMIFPPEELLIVKEDLSVLLREPFDLIFFTGGLAAGQRVAEAAARTMTPCVLELGGKSPCIVDETASLKRAAERIVWGKFLNAGQSCVAPDYLLVQRTVKDALMLEIRKAIKRFYGENPAESPAYSRVINTYHFERLMALMSEGRVVAGGESNPDRKYIEPTVLDGISWDSPIMQSEIFGPLLPVLEYDTLAEALLLISRRPKPLALYLFSRSGKAVQRVLRESSSGNVAINDTMIQALNPNLPFGGIGASGLGRYHGKYSFDTFSHLKSVQKKSSLPELLRIRFAPYSRWKLALLRFFAK